MGVLLIASYILTLRFMAEYECVDAEKCECDEERYVIKFEKNKETEPVIPENNLFSLTVGAKNDFLNRGTYSYINKVFENDQSSIEPDSVAFNAIHNNTKIRY